MERVKDALVPKPSGGGLLRPGRSARDAGGAECSAAACCAAAPGEIIVDATSGNSGNDSRDKKMHKEVLESARYAEVIFRPDRVEGKITPQGTFAVQVHGLFILHGSEHELTVPVQAEFAGDHWTGRAKFNVPFIDWGLKNPGNFFLKVNHAVEIELELKGRLENPVAP